MISEDQTKQKEEVKQYIGEEESRLSHNGKTYKFDNQFFKEYLRISSFTGSSSQEFINSLMNVTQRNNLVAKDRIPF